MAVNWTKNLAVGVDEIDEQHQELFRRINRLYQAITSGSNTEEGAKMLQFLYEYTDYHFKAEERHMEAHDYPHLRPHASQHRHFIADLYKLQKELDNEGTSVEFSVAVQRRVRDWLVTHIQREDKRYGLYLEDQQH